MLKPLKFNIKFFFIVLVILFYSCKEDKKTDSTFAFTNDLIHETSPYLLQHAHNPVNWRAWSPEIFEEAQKEDKLVLISIGYSSCHWCHVMEKETFEDEEVAKIMNENYISVKVDREERPDVDQVYQTAIQLIGENGGWPLNAITLPNGKPLYLGTYLPKAQWNEVLQKVNALYRENPEQANSYADGLSQGIQETNLLEISSEFEKLTVESLQASIENWKPQWDADLGGDKGLQKFMSFNALNFLLDYGVLTKDAETLKHVENTLNQMANGGIYDHIGGGFYRYSTDPQWKVPHFEKMLYDNAQAVGLYSKAYSVFEEPIFKDIVFETIAFLDREMKNPEGGYYATLDADSDGEEGKFYVWKLKELNSVLGKDFDLFAKYFNVQEQNAWEEDKYILYKGGDEKGFLAENGMSTSDFTKLKSEWRTKLLKVRETRVRPTTDDKILTSWNALLIKGLTKAYETFGEASLLNNATSIFDFIQSKSYSNEKLLHSFKEGSKQEASFLEDYTFLADASLELYSATTDDKYLDFSKELTQVVERDFTDAATGMYTFNKNQELISKIIKTNDGDIPSANSVMAHNLLRIGHIDYNKEYLNKAKTMLTTLLPRVNEYPNGYAHWNSLLANVTHPYFEIAVIGKNAEELVKELQKKNIPNALIVGNTSESEAPLFKDRYFEAETFIYVCQNSTCKLPVKTVAEALVQIKNF
ncbi:thioredoxin domain-containing protein [Maribacter algarum]|nr:thioredoxin domain-containing protein [Maribacter algarum]